jgi:hypothetical protein
MKYILISVVLIVAYYIIKKGQKTNVNPPSSNISNETGYSDYHDTRLTLHISKDLPINWGSHHSGIGYVGDAAIVNCEYILAGDWSANRKWNIRLENISRYAIEKNNNNNWVHIHFYLNDGSQEVLVVKSKEVSPFEKAYGDAVKSFYEMKEFMAQDQQS